MTRANLADVLGALFGLVCGLVGVIEAANRDQPGLSVLFGLVLVVVIMLALRLRRVARAVPVRQDVHAWLETMAVVGGESSSDVADRAISSFRARLHE